MHSSWRGKKMIVQLRCFLVLASAATALHAQPPCSRSEEIEKTRPSCLYRFRESLHYWVLGPRYVASDMPIHMPYQTAETYYYFRPYQGTQSFSYQATTGAGLQAHLTSLYRRRAGTASRPMQSPDRLEYVSDGEPIQASTPSPQRARK